MKDGTPTLKSVIDGAIAAALLEVHTAMPGRVVSYNKTTQTATVQPIIRKNAKVRIPPIPGVSVMFQGNDVISIAWPVKKGDTGLLVFAESSMDKWKTGDGDDVDPGDLRRFDLSDAMFIPALRSRKKPIPAAGVHDTALVIEAPQAHICGDAPLALKADALSLKDAIEGLVCSNGTITHPLIDVNGTSKLRGG